MSHRRSFGLLQFFHLILRITTFTENRNTQQVEQKIRLATKVATRAATKHKREAKIKSIESSITKLPSIKASKAWAYGMEYPWTPQSIARACHSLLLYALWTASLETTLQPFQGWLLS
jgi:hypothetical protein